MALLWLFRNAFGFAYFPLWDILASIDDICIASTIFNLSKVWRSLSDLGVLRLWLMNHNRRIVELSVGCSRVSYMTWAVWALDVTNVGGPMDLGCLDSLEPLDPVMIRWPYRRHIIGSPLGPWSHLESFDKLRTRWSFRVTCGFRTLRSWVWHMVFGPWSLFREPNSFFGPEACLSPEFFLRTRS